MAARKDTPARLAKARRDPAIALPPKPPTAERRSALTDMRITINGVGYTIGPAVEGDPEMSATIDGSATLTVAVRDQDARLQQALSDEANILTDGVSVTINDVIYMLQAAAVDETGTLLTLTFEDQVSWRLKRFSRFVTFSRTHNTRAQAALKLIKEASGSPQAPLGYYIPQLNDRQRVAAPTSDGGDITSKGTGAAAGYQVKHRRADAEQRAVIDGALTEALRLGATRRVMVAVVMCMTQESACRRLAHGDNARSDTIGAFQQGPEWIARSKVQNPALATRAFLLGHEADVGGTDHTKRGWKQRFGSVKNAPGDLNAAITQVQGSVGGYAQWGDEASATVNRWRAADSSQPATVVEPYEFARGSKDGERETSWDALGRWAEEVGWRRWAQNNTLFYVSDDELRAAAPVLQLDGDEDWLLAPPAFDWAPDRPVQDVTLRVLAQRWGVQVGAATAVNGTGPAAGRLLVTQVDGYMVNPETTVTLRRPATKKPEPAPSTHEATTSTGDGKAGSLLQACAQISKHNYPYVWGGGHAHAGTPDRGTGAAPGVGYDCSGAVGAALAQAGMGVTRGKPVPGSGWFAASWGKPGRGQQFTVWANATHIWIEFHHAANVKAFDTRRVGDNSAGPHTRKATLGDQARFSARHWPGS
jgi:hypothetical protein